MERNSFFTSLLFQVAELKPIAELCEELGLDSKTDVDYYGNYKAKVSIIRFI